MAYTKTRARLFWGALDLEYEYAAVPSYGGTDYVTLGESAANGEGIGVRRATLVLNRDAATPSDDACEMHFDFLNTTGGEPDDTWTSADYATLEGLLLTWWTSIKTLVPTDTAYARVLWNRVGPGVPKPNPAERILDIATPIAGTTTRAAAPQISMAISFRHPVRRAWGRTYLPYGGAAASNGRSPTGHADQCVTNTITLFNAAKAADFAPVVVSVKHASALLIESVVCDTTLDIIRRRRWKHTAYKKTTAVT